MTTREDGAELVEAGRDSPTAAMKVAQSNSTTRRELIRADRCVKICAFLDTFGSECYHQPRC